MNHLKNLGINVLLLQSMQKKKSKNWNVFINGGRVDTGIDAISWAKNIEKRGAGEILLTSMDRMEQKTGLTWN